MISRKEHESELLASYQSTGDKQHLNKLLESFDPLIQREVNVFKTAPVPTEAVKLQAQILAKKAFDTFDPTMGFQINTHLVNNLKKLNRFIYENQNLAKIPEHRILKITQFKSIKEQLREQLWREPTTEEVANEMRISPAEVARLESELRQDLVIQNESTNEDGGGFFLDAQQFTDKTKEAIMFVYHSMTEPKVKLLMEYYFGLEGKPRYPIMNSANMAGLTYAVAVKELKKISDMIQETEFNLS